MGGENEPEANPSGFFFFFFYVFVVLFSMVLPLPPLPFFFFVDFIKLTEVGLKTRQDNMMLITNV